MRFGRLYVNPSNTAIRFINESELKSEILAEFRQFHQTVGD
jgi:hypothetical protein